MDQELYANFLNRVLQTGDILKTKSGQKVIYQEHPIAWYGRLANPGVIPGLYRDRYRVVIKNGDLIETIAVNDVEFDDPTVLEARRRALPENWYQLNFEADVILDRLPPTLFLESDTIFLSDKSHSMYKESYDLIDPETGENKGPIPIQQINQYTVYRIYYQDSFDWDSRTQQVHAKITGSKGSNPKYRLRAGKIQFDAYQNQLQLLTRGPVKMFYSTETFELPWRSLKDEAEFYLLLGRFSRQYNRTAESYLWELKDARLAILNGHGEAILKNPEGYWLVKFWDQSIGDQIKCETDLILDI